MKITSGKTYLKLHRNLNCQKICQNFWDGVLGKALAGYNYDRVVSSIPSAIAETKKSAEDAKISARTAEKRAEKIAKFTLLGSAVGAVAVVAAILGLFWNSWSLQRGYLDKTVEKVVLQIDQSHKNDMEKINTDTQELIKQQNLKISSLEQQIERLEKENRQPAVSK